MDTNKSTVSERIAEIEMVCERNNPIYEQISNFSIALYALDHFDAPDLLSVDDLDGCEASEIVSSHFEKIEANDIPPGYCLSESKERYLMVMGDPMFPTHYAAVVDTKSQRPFFSKLKFMGSGYDSLEELMKEHSVDDAINHQDIFFYRKKEHS